MHAHIMHACNYLDVLPINGISQKKLLLVMITLDINVILSPWGTTVYCEIISPQNLVVLCSHEAIVMDRQYILANFELLVSYPAET